MSEEEPLQIGEIGVVIHANPGNKIVNDGDELLVVGSLTMRSVIYTFDGTIAKREAYVCNCPPYELFGRIFTICCPLKHQLRRKKLPPEQKSKDDSIPKDDYTPSTWSHPFWKSIGLDWQKELVEVETETEEEHK